MWIGYSKTKNTKILEFHSTKVPIKILGAHLSYNVDKNNDANFFVKIRKMKTKLACQLPVGLLAQLVRALHRYRRGQGSNPGKPDFF